MSWLARLMIKKTLALFLMTSTTWAAPLVVVGPVTGDATNLLEGVVFLGAGPLTVDTFDIGATNGVSVAGGGAGTRIIFNEVSTIQGSVTDPVSTLSLITINNADAKVTAAGTVKVDTLNFAADGQFSMAAGKNLTASVATDVLGTGTLILEGSSTLTGTITGLKAVTFNAGDSIINNNITNTTNTSILSGSLTINNPLIINQNLVNNGVLNIGSNALTVGTYIGGASSVINIYLGATSGLLNITAALPQAIPNSSVLNVLIKGNDIVNGTLYNNIISADTGLASGPIIPNTPLYAFVPTYAANNLSITVNRTQSLTQAMQNFPALAGISNFFDMLGPQIETTGLVPVYDLIRAQSSDAALTFTLLTMQPLVNGHLLTATDLARPSLDLVDDCIKGCGDVWIKALAGSAEQKNSVGDYEGHSAGVAIGMDRKVGRALKLGVGLGYTKVALDSTLSNQTTNQIINQIKSHNYQGFLYARHRYNAWLFDGLVGYTYHDIEQNRIFLDNIPSHLGAWQYNMYLKAGYGMQYKKLLIEPQLLFQYAQVNFNPYDESGINNNIFNLRVDYGKMPCAQGGIGLKLTSMIDLKHDRIAQPYIKIKSLMRLHAPNIVAKTHFLALPETQWQVPGIKSNALSFAIQTGLRLSKGMNHLVFDYAYEKTVYAANKHVGFIYYQYHF